MKCASALALFRRGRLPSRFAYETEKLYALIFSFKSVSDLLARLSGAGHFDLANVRISDLNMGSGLQIVKLHIPLRGRLRPTPDEGQYIIN